MVRFEEGAEAHVEQPGHSPTYQGLAAMAASEEWFRVLQLVARCGPWPECTQATCGLGFDSVVVCPVIVERLARVTKWRVTLLAARQEEQGQMMKGADLWATILDL